MIGINLYFLFHHLLLHKLYHCLSFLLVFHIYTNHFRFYYILGKCGAISGAVGTEEGAVARWNTRAYENGSDDSAAKN